MAIGNLAACLAVTLKHEGGWSDHPADPGGATMKGVTIGRYREYYPNATKTDLRNISDSDLQRIYRNDYWNKVRGDDLPYGVDLATFDAGVNSGPSRGVRWLQSALGIKQDGVAGPGTVKAAIIADAKATIQKLCAKRLSFVHGLTTWKTFGKGWARRIADIEARAVTMWLTRGSGKVDASEKRVLQDEAKKAATKSKTQGAGSATAGGGAGVGGGDAIVNGNSGWIVAAIVAVLVIGAVVLYVKSRQNRERASAYVEAAAG